MHVKGLPRQAPTALLALATSRLFYSLLEPTIHRPGGYGWTRMTGRGSSRSSIAELATFASSSVAGSSNRNSICESSLLDCFFKFKMLWNPTAVVLNLDRSSIRWDKTKRRIKPTAINRGDDLIHPDPESKLTAQFLQSDLD